MNETGVETVFFDLDDTLYDCTGSLVEQSRLRWQETRQQVAVLEKVIERGPSLPTGASCYRSFCMGPRR